MDYAELLIKIEQEITGKFHEADQLPLIYHNLRHTKLVVKHAKKIATHYQLNEEDWFIVLASAWFHDIGYLQGNPDNHEQTGIQFARQFLQHYNLPVSVTDAIANCIAATRIPQQPVTLIEKIVSDADLFHFGLPEFSAMNKLMRKEMQFIKGKKIDKEEWNTATLEMLEIHQFKTSYANERLNEGKEENLKILLKKQEAYNHSYYADKIIIEENKNEFVEIDKSIPITKRPARGIETMFRISSNNHQRLSDMADNKANIMITTTSIILSILLSVLLRKLEDNPHLILPSFLLLTVCLVTMIFSIKSTRPALPAGTFSKQDLDEQKTNLLFFGNFYNMSYKDYHEGMEAMMKDRNFLYGSLTLDVYSQGKVLGKKYKLLRYAYNTFMYGITAAVIAFFVAVLIAM